MLAFIQQSPYAASFITGAALTAWLAWWHGLRAGWTLPQRTAVIAAVLIGGNIGSRWLPVEGVFPQDGDKTVVGALLGAGLFLFVAGRAVGLGARAFDAAIPGVPIGMAIGRVGCFLAGCCFGTPTALPWGVRYASGSLPFARYADAGSLAEGSIDTGALHPAQLYESLLDVAMLLVVLRVRPRLRAAGSSPLLFAALYAVARFALEFVRYDGTPIAGLKPLQWGLLAVAPAIVLLLVRRERAARRRDAHAVRAPRSGVTPRWIVGGADRRFAPLALALMVATAASLRFASPVEVLCFEAATLLVLYAIAQRYHAGKQTMAPVGALALLFQAQGSPGDAPGYPRTVATLGGVFTTASFGTVETVHVPTGGAPVEACEGQFVTPTRPVDVRRDHVIRMFGLSGGIRGETAPGQGTGLAADLLFGADQMTAANAEGQTSPDRPAERLALAGGRLIGNFDGRRVGLMLGGTFGSVAARKDHTDRQWGIGRVGAAPAAGLRIGPLSRSFLEVAVNNSLSGFTTAPSYRANIGVALGNQGSVLRVGTEDSHLLLNLRYVTRGGLEIEPTVGSPGTIGGVRFGLGVRKRFVLTRPRD